MLMIEPGVPGGQVAAGELAGAEERAVEGDVDDGAPGVRRHVLGRHREVGGRVVDQHVGQTEAASAASKAAAIWSGSRMSHSTVSTSPPSGSSAAGRPRGARPCGWRSRCRRRGGRTRWRSPCRARCPPPVTNTVVPAKLPAGRAVAPAEGGSGKPIGADMAVALSSRCSGVAALGAAARSSAMSSERLMKVWPISSSAIDDRISGSARCLITRRAIFTVTAGAAAIFSAISSATPSSSSRGHDARHDAVGVRLGGVHGTAGEDHVAGDAVAADLEQASDPAGVGDDAVGHLREHEAGALGGDADVAQQRPLERAADRPALAWRR